MDVAPFFKEKAIGFFSLVLIFASVSFGQSLASQQDPGHKEDATVANVKFSVPQGYSLEQTADPNVVLMRHSKYGLAIFVAVPKTSVDKDFLKDLSNILVRQLVPKEKDFTWKLLPFEGEGKTSKFQTANGNTKGYNGNKMYQTDYIAVRANERDVLIGYITELGQFNNSQKFLFDLKGVAGMSMPGWYAQAHVLASITGEKYEEINRGTVITGTPVKPKN